MRFCLSKLNMTNITSLSPTLRRNETKHCRNISHGSNSWSLFFVTLYILCQQLHLVDGSQQETVWSNNEYLGENFIDNDDDLDVDDWLLVVVLSLLFSFCISLFGSVLGYISMLDDSIIRGYSMKGEVIRADISSAEFARGGGGKAGICSITGGDNEAEYLVIVEYNRMLSETYRVRIRKQVRAKQGDFVDPDIPMGSDSFVNDNFNSNLDDDEEDMNDMNYPESQLNIKNNMNSRSPTRSGSTLPSLTPASPENLPPPRINARRIITNQESFLQKYRLESQKLELYVLPDMPKSGYPVRQVERSQTLKYRLSTLGLVVANLLLALLCFRMAATSIAEQEDKKEQSIGWIIFWSFVCLTVLEIPIIHCFFNSMLQHILEEEYYETADFAPTGQDDSSLSSGSDVYLHGARCRALSGSLSPCGRI